VSLEQEFQREMVEGTALLKKEIGYNPSRWMQMVGAHGAVEAAKRLLAGPRASDGFTTLWEAGRLDMSVEFAILKPEYELLFSDAEREEARRRLELYEFDVDSHLRKLAPVTLEKRLERIGVAEPVKTLDRPVLPPEEGPVVRPIVSAEAAAERPTVEDLAAARKLFGEHEPRDIFYRAARDLIDLAREGRASVSVALVPPDVV
jgi:hypothetical protein